MVQYVENFVILLCFMKFGILFDMCNCYVL